MCTRQNPDHPGVVPTEAPSRNTSASSCNVSVPGGTANVRAGLVRAHRPVRPGRSPPPTSTRQGLHQAAEHPPRLPWTQIRRRQHASRPFQGLPEGHGTNAVSNSAAASAIGSSSEMDSASGSGLGRARVSGEESASRHCARIGIRTRAEKPCAPIRLGVTTDLFREQRGGRERRCVVCRLCVECGIGLRGDPARRLAEARWARSRRRVGRHLTLHHRVVPHAHVGDH